MASTVVSTLYPPLIDTFQPAFVYTDSVLVTFSLSPFNSISDIKRVHVSVVDQRNNSNVLKGFLSPTEQTINSESTGKYYSIVNGILIADLPVFENEEQTEEVGIFCYDPINDIYAVKIDPVWLNRNDTNNAYWNNNQYYQVQIRFDSSDDKDLISYSETELAGYLLNNRQYFSEWSSITLLKPILKPEITIEQLDREKEPLIYRGNFHITGSIEFKAPSVDLNGVSYPEEERLQTYRVKVTYNNDDEETKEIEVFDSDWIYAKQNILKSEKTMIDLLLNLTALPEDFQNIVTITFFCRTNNNYIWKEDRKVRVNSLQKVLIDSRWNNDEENLEANEVYINQEDGIVNIRFKATIDESDDKIKQKGILYFRRSSSKDNFQTQDLIYKYIYERSVDDSNPIPVVEVNFNDFTVCSLYQYKYFVQMCVLDAGEDWSNIIESARVYPEFYDMLLMRKNKQIAIRYNGQITSWKPTVNRQKIDTLGGRYPKFVENASMNYKAYSISGLISAEEDFNRIFLNEKNEEKETGKDIGGTGLPGNITAYHNKFGDTYLLRNDTYADGVIVYPEKNQPTHRDKKGEIKGKNLYASEGGFSGQLNEWHDSYPHNHWYWEREFREELVKWLNDGEPKLYRSMPEGNIAVMLTDINLTPDVQLGRMLYNFSATMYEIADGYNLEDLNNLGIIDIPDFVNVFINGTDINGNISQETEEANIGNKKSNKIGQTIFSFKNTNLDLINGYFEDRTQASYNPDDLWNNISIAEKIEEYLQGSNVEELKNGSIKITNADIQFLSPPDYYNRTENGKFEKANGKTKWLGYVLEIKSDSSEDYQQIFINQKGFYHIPNTVTINKIKLGAENQVAQMFYIYEYRTTYRSEKSFTPERIEKHIIGQYTDQTLPLNTNIISLIQQDYYKERYNIQESDNTKRIMDVIRLEQCEGVLLDLTPYTFLKYTYADDNTNYPLLIGETGIFNGFKNWPINSLFIYGRRLTKIENDSYHIEDREYRLDDSVGSNPSPSYSWNIVNPLTISAPIDIIINNQKYNLIRDANYIDSKFIEDPDTYGYILTSQIKNPKFNTVYKFTKSISTTNNNPTIESYYQIYYIDRQWYPIIFMEDNSILAAVPVYGMINYHANLLRRSYNNE